MKYLIGTAIFALLTPFNVFARAKDVKDIFSEIHHTNQMEMELGKMAQEKGSSQEVKNFGKTLYQDHQKNDQLLKRLANSMDVNFEDVGPTDKQEKTKEKLKKAQGKEFDRKFLKAMQEGHEKTIKELDKLKEDFANDTQVSQFIKTTLPTLEKHRNIADDRKEDI